MIAATTAGAAALMAATTLGATSAAAGAASRDGAHATAKAASGGVIKWAEQGGSAPNSIFPVTTTTTQTGYNIAQFIPLMYEELYLPSPTAPVLDYAHSIGQQPVWSDNDTVATIHLNHYLWTDGTPVTARDCVFYINLAIAEGTTWGSYAGPTQFPYNLKSYTAVNPTTLKLVLKAPINPTFYDDNGIGVITPIPQQAWDKESANGPIGNFDMTPAGAKKVVTFLEAQSADQSTYTTNPLWKVTDGAWTLKSYGGQSSPDVFVPNPKYSGHKASVSEFEEVPFTTDTAEYTSLKAGTSVINVGYIPPQDIPTVPAIKAEGYNVFVQPLWQFNYIIPNTKNPQVGPILSQVYVRQALEKLTDQDTMITHFMDGYGSPTYGPVPAYPKNDPFLSSAESTNPYPYSVSGAEKLLEAHGWKIDPNGVDVCARGGAGVGRCGAGVSKGEKLSLNLLEANGLEISTEDTDLFVSDAAKAGVQINVRWTDFNTVVSQVQPCVLPKDKGTPLCNWQLGEYGGLGQSTFPSGVGVLNTGGAFNAGQYSNPKLDKLIYGSTTASSLSVFKGYENLAVQQEPWIWQPVPSALDATVKGLTGYSLTNEFTGITNGYIEPQFWSFTK